MECIHVANAQHKVIIFCKSRPLNWKLKDNNNQQRKKSSKFDHHDYKALHDTSLKGASEWKSIVEISHSVWQ